MIIEINFCRIQEKIIIYIYRAYFVTVDIQY